MRKFKIMWIDGSSPTIAEADHYEVKFCKESRQPFYVLFKSYSSIGQFPVSIVKLIQET